MHATCDPVTNRYLPDEQPAVDQWTFWHGIVGAMYAMRGVPWWAALSLGIGWEIVENDLKRRYPDVFPDPCYDSPINARYDVAAVMVGWAAVKILGG